MPEPNQANQPFLPEVDPKTKDHISKIMTNGLEQAVTMLVHIAQFGQSERARIDAAKYLLDRCLGKMPDKLLIDGLAPLRDLLGDIVLTDVQAAGAAEERAIAKAQAIRAAREKGQT